MKNFDFCIPTKIVFGKGRISEIGNYAKYYGKKLLLVYGKGSIKKNGIYDTVIKSLKKAQLIFMEYPGVKSNPILSHVHKGIEIMKKENFDFILAVGGGSVIDTSKAMAAGVCYDGDVWDFYKGTAKVKAALPILTILTIPASGSEMNCGTVITNEKTKQKFGFDDDHLYPKVSILDPTTTYTIPSNYTAYSAVDAIMHVLEGYFTHEDKWLPIQDRYAEGIVKTIMESADIILKSPTDYSGRSTLMWAAALAKNGFSTAGVEGATNPNHMFGHVLSAYYDIAHGASISIIFPAWMKYKYKENIYRFAKFAENVFDIKKKNTEKAALSGIEALKNWFKNIGSPVSFKDANLPIDQLDNLSESIFELSKIWHIEGYSRDIIYNILKLCL